MPETISPPQSTPPHKTQIPVPPSYGASETASMNEQVEGITTNVVMAIREVIKTAERLEALMVQNAARVKEEITAHIELASRVKQEAARLGEVVVKLGETQISIASERKGNGHH